MLEWLWEYGEKCQIARSIPQLDPRTIYAIHHSNDIVNEGNPVRGGALIDSDMEKDEEYFYSTIRAIRRIFVMKGTAEGTYRLLLELQNFKPELYWDKSSSWHADVGYEKWHISFSVRHFEFLS